MSSDAVQDGWGHDDEDGVFFADGDDDEGEGEQVGKGGKPAAVAPPPPENGRAENGGGDNLEDDLEDGEVWPEEGRRGAPAEAPAPARPSSPVAAALEKAWSEEEEEKKKRRVMMVPPPSAAPVKKKKEEAPAAGAGVVVQRDGWDDDDEEEDLDFDDDDWPEQEETPVAGEPTTATTATRAPPTAAGVAASAPHQSPVERQLREYLSSLRVVAASLSAVLRAEFNTPEKAVELQRYYAGRPGLTEYTCQKEVPRMDYAVRCGGGEEGGRIVVTDKAAVAQLLRRHDATGSLLPRCANQSLLADLLHACTGRDGLVRPQFLASASARSCEFRIDLQQHTVQVISTLELTLPANSVRWKVADIAVQVTFGCPPIVGQQQQPFVEYRLLRLESVPQDDAAWRQRLSRVAALLTELHPPEEEPVVEEEEENDAAYRDHFLQQRDPLLFVNAAADAAAAGMRSTWRDVQVATGIGGKLGGVLRLPDAAELEAVAAAQEEEEEEEGSPAGAAVVPQQQQRPKSILGGFVKTLAKKVALPEEDPALYRQWEEQPPSQQQRSGQPPGVGPVVAPAPSPPPWRPATAAACSAPPQSPPPPSKQSGLQLYNRTTPEHQQQMKPAVPAAPGLLPELDYKKEEPQQSQSTKRSKLDKAPVRDEEPKATRREEPAIRLYRREESLNRQPPPVAEDIVEDGWGDDDDDVAWDDVETGGDAMTASVEPAVVQRKEEEEEEEEEWVYDPETDIIPCRKRWVNPVPGPRELPSYLARLGGR